MKQEFFVTTYQLNETAGPYFVKVFDGLNGTDTRFMITSQTTTPEATVSSVITTDKVEYGPEEVVTIKGSGFQPNATVNVEIIRPDNNFDLLTVNSDGEGVFVTTYQLDATAGLYFVKAYDGLNGTDTKFIQ